MQIFFDTATFVKIESNQKINIASFVKDVVGGTMGLFSGFSIISGLEIIFFLIRLIKSLKITDSIAEIVAVVRKKFKKN